VSAARRVLIAQSTEESHDDLCDALAMAVWLVHQFEGQRARAMRDSMMPRQPARHYARPINL
jgi:hypothetical protein